MSITTLAPQDQPQGYILPYFKKLTRTVFLCRIFVECSVRTVYPTKFSNLWCSDSWKYICKSKYWIYFYSCPQDTPTPPVSYHYTPEREKSPIPPDSKIYSVPAEMGGRENCLMKPSNDNSKEEYKFRIIHDLLLSFWIQKAIFMGVLLQELNLETVVLCRSCCIYGPSQISVWLGLVYLQY